MDKKSVLENSNSYPHLKLKKNNTLSLSHNVEKVLHISTPLITLINFYI